MLFRENGTESSARGKNEQKAQSESFDHSVKMEVSSKNATYPLDAKVHFKSLMEETKVG